MPDFIELFKEIDINNVFFLIALSIGIIVIFASCMGPFFASSIEILFMSKEDELKRISLTYVIMFFTFGVVNYIFMTDISFIVLCIVAIGLMLVLYIILWIINKCGKLQSIFSLYKERFGITIIVIFIPIITHACSITTGVKTMGCAVLGALAEIIIMAIIYLNPTPRNSTVFIKIDNIKWYVFRKIDDEHLLCGDKNNVTKCTVIKVLEFNTVVHSDIYLEKNDERE